MFHPLDCVLPGPGERFTMSRRRNAPRAECPGRWLLTGQHHGCVRDVVWLDEEAVWLVRESRANDGSSTIPSMMISETWIPDGPSERASDSARLRCAALAEANAAVLAPPRREAVAPMKIMFPAARRFIAGMTLCAAAKAPNVLVRHAVSKSSRVTSSAEPQTPFARIVNEDIDRSEIGFDRSEDPFHRGRIAHIASIGTRQGEFLRQSARQAGAAGQQRDGKSFRGEPAGEGGAIAGADANDDTDRLLGWLGRHGGTFFQAEQTARGFPNEVHKN